jgi:hypothetical protein
MAEIRTEQAVMITLITVLPCLIKDSDRARRNLYEGEFNTVSLSLTKSMQKKVDNIK